MTPQDLLQRTRIGPKGDAAFPGAALQGYFESLVPPPLRRPVERFVLIAAMHAAVHALNSRSYSRAALVVGLHAGDPDVLATALAGTRPDLALLTLPMNAATPTLIRYLSLGPRRIEGLLFTPGVTPAQRRDAVATTYRSCLIQVFAQPTPEDAAAGATLWRSGPDAQPSVGVVVA